MDEWTGCYNDSWKGLIVPEAFSHPAKVSPGLAKRIFEHCFEKGYLKEGDVCGDPFMGVCGFGIFAAPMKIQFVGVELESKFVDLSKQNIELHRHAWETMGYPIPTILQGDSRRFSEIINGATGLITSPPYAETVKNTGDGIDWGKATRGGHQPGMPRYDSTAGVADGYGVTEGNIGNLKSGDISEIMGCDGIVTSPPYAETPLGQTNKSVERHAEIQKAKGSKRTWGKNFIDDYGSNPSNIGNLIPETDSKRPMPDVRSNETVGDSSQERRSLRSSDRELGDSLLVVSQQNNSENMVGEKEEPPTYWSEMLKIYIECWKALKDGGVMVVVIKSYVKGGKIVDLPEQTWQLLQHVGFKPLERIRAMLVSETRENGLFGEIVKIKARKSFFRRLAEKKGSPRIDFEEVLWLVK